MELFPNAKADCSVVYEGTDEKFKVALILIFTVAEYLTDALVNLALSCAVCAS